MYYLYYVAEGRCSYEDHASNLIELHTLGEVEAHKVKIKELYKYSEITFTVIKGDKIS